MIISLIIVHEFGHLFTALIYKWNLKNITIYPFGGCVKFDDKLNRPIKEELLILISGPLFQILFFFFLYYLFSKGYITYRNINIIKKYHYTLLIFNLLPIYPLDGGRILNLIFNYFIPYKKSNKIIIIISIVAMMIALCFYKNINFFLMGILLFIEIISYLNRQDYLYNRFLLERFINNYNYKKYKIIKNKDLMYKDKRHIILYKDKYVTEKEYLNDRFKVIK